MLLDLVVVLMLVLLNGFFVAAEFALLRSRRTRLEAMTRSGDRKARLALRALGNLPRVLSACQLGITLSSIALGYVAVTLLGSEIAARLAGLPVAAEVSLRAALGATVALVTISFLHAVVGEHAPRTMALNHPESIARWLAGPVLWIAWLLTPFTFVVGRVSHLLLAALGQRRLQDDEPAPTGEELRLLVEESQEGGGLEQYDAELIEGVFEFSEKNAREVMTPRTEIVALAAETSLDEAVAIVEESGLSRIPVFEETIDRVVGLVLAKDLLRVLVKRPATFRLADIMRPVHVVPATREVGEVLTDFKRLKEHLAIVLDEYGGTAGLVTMEDLLEEIVGEILDEYDEADVAAAQPAAGEVLVPGSMNVDELNERYGLDVASGDYTTVGGVVFGLLGRVPAVNDRVVTGGAVLSVRRMDGRRIETLAVDLHSAGDRRSAERDAMTRSDGAAGA